MPVIFQGECSSCGYQSPFVSDGYYGAVIVDNSCIIEKQDSDPNDERIVVLAHPLEQDIIEKYGFTYSSATLQGRYLQMHDLFCKSCGNVYETRRLAAATLIFGCLPPILIAVLLGIVIGIFQSSILDGLFGAFTASLFSWLTIDWLVGVYVRLRYAERSREFYIPRVCPKCGSRRAAIRGVLPCPTCRQPSMKVKTIGMS